VAISKKKKSWTWAFLTLLLLVVIVVFVSQTHKPAQTVSNILTVSPQLQDCENTAHQKYDPLIAAAVSLSASQKSTKMEQQALDSCQQEYGDSQ
jgi:uncharacterized protein YgiB involved in biofilm formation